MKFDDHKKGAKAPQDFTIRINKSPGDGQENCQDCNEIVDCEAGTGAGTGSGFGSGSSSSGSRVSNGQAQCVTTCNSNGGCSVKIVNGPPGKSSGSCFPPDFKGRCSGIPDLCARGNHISTQCGSPCEAGTRNV